MRVCGLLANRVLTGEQFGDPFGRFRVGLRQQMGIPVKHRPWVVAQPGGDDVDGDSVHEHERGGRMPERV
jgi:hypothetical protein